MIESVIQGIADKLDAAFGPECRVYGNYVSQNLETPCFLINPVNPRREQQLGSREARLYPFDVVYMPTAADREELFRTAEKLLLELRIIQTAAAGALRGKDMNFNITDGVLHFLVTYDFSVCETKEIENPMEGLAMKGV